MFRVFILILSISFLDLKSIIFLICLAYKIKLQAQFIIFMYSYTIEANQILTFVNTHHSRIKTFKIYLPFQT